MLLLANFLVFGLTFRPAHSAGLIPRRSGHSPICIDELAIKFVRSIPDAIPILLESLRRDTTQLGSEARNCSELIDLLDKLADSGQLNGRVKRLQFVVGGQRKEWNVAGMQVSKDVVRKTAKTWATFGWQVMADDMESGD